MKVCEREYASRPNLFHLEPRIRGQTSDACRPWAVHFPCSCHHNGRVPVAELEVQMLGKRQHARNCIRG
eukprot:7750613-Alexandrium_andersonii.AAC.1